MARGSRCTVAAIPIEETRTHNRAGVLFWGIRVVVPGKLRGKLLEELHRDHPGISCMNAIARGYMWWPGLDRLL